MAFDAIANVAGVDHGITRSYNALWSSVLLATIQDCLNGCSKAKRALLDKENRRQLVFLAGLEPEFEAKLHQWCHYNRDNPGKWVLTSAMEVGWQSVKPAFGQDARTKKKRAKHYRPKQLIELEHQLLAERRARRRGKRTRAQIEADNAHRAVVLTQNGFAEYL